MLRQPGFLRPLFAVTTLVAAAVVHGQNINVTAANASNDAIYSVVFNNAGGGSISVLNTDGGSLHNLTSLVFRTNPATLQLDLLAADNGGRIVVYPGDFQFGGQSFGNTVPQNGTGPANPDALSVDNAGDLFVVNAKSGSTSNPQLWVLPTNPADVVAGGFLTPIMLDSNYGSREVLAETLVASTTVSLGAVVVNPGDLLVLTSSPGQVLVYPGSNGNGPLTACTPPGATGCVPAAPPTVLITLPTGAIPGGMAFWPVDNSLLITTTRGTILQYHFPAQAGDPASFMNLALGNGQFKIKTGVQFGQPFAYVANNNGGDILEFGLNSQATVTSGVQHPQGLAVTNIGYGPLTGCEAPNTCDLVGNDALGKKVLTHLGINSNLQNGGNIVEDVCVVNTDPRGVTPDGKCTGTLVVNQICPGFDNTHPPAGPLQIDSTLCGGSGPTHGFALVRTLTQAYKLAFPPFNGALIFTDSDVDNVLPPLPPPNGNPRCNPLNAPGMPPAPLGTIAWAPLDLEGINPGGAKLIDITSACDTGGRGSGYSLWAIGLALNSSVDLVGYTRDKYTTLSSTIQNEVTEQALTSPPPQFTQCIATSQAAFNKGSSYYGGAAVELLAADNQVQGVAKNNPPFNPNANADYPNPSGTLSMLLENLYYTIMTRLLYFNAGTNGPPSAAPAPQLPAPSPSMTGTPAPTGKVGTVYTFKPIAADFAGNSATLTYSFQHLPSWLLPTVTNGELTLSGLPVKGTYSGIVITVSDGCATYSLPAFQIKVTG